ncbi:MAG: hypothetical protein K6C14_08370 [Eubacterium sp.]|nr:hypothetical protein [Eubacterium sp.]
MAKTVPMIITNKDILVKLRDSDEFTAFEMPGIEENLNIPFYHQFAKRIAECQKYFKDFIRELYGKHLSKNILAIIVPDDTSALERIFIKEFFLNSGACKAVVQMTMGQALSKEHQRYISISMSTRNITLQYIGNNEVKAQKYYDINNYDPKVIFEDSKRLHIDIEYAGVPVFVNNFNLNMDDFFEMGQVITPKEFMDKIAVIDVEKV